MQNEEDASVDLIAEKEDEDFNAFEQTPIPTFLTPRIWPKVFVLKVFEGREQGHLLRA